MDTTERWGGGGGWGVKMERERKTGGGGGGGGVKMERERKTGLHDPHVSPASALTLMASAHSVRRFKHNSIEHK